MAKFLKGEFVLVPNREQALKLRGADLSVYLAICAHADKDGQCYPSRTTIEGTSGYGRTVVKESLKNLVEQGLLSITPRERDNGSHTSNLYQIMIVGVATATQGGAVERPPITKPINYLAKARVRQEKELLELVNKIIGRNFRTLPNKGVKKTLDSFTLVEIEASLRALAVDDWHEPKLKEFSIDYLIRPTTIDKFLPANIPTAADQEARKKREAEADEEMRKFREAD